MCEEIGTPVPATDLIGMSRGKLCFQSSDAIDQVHQGDDSFGCIPLGIVRLIKGRRFPACPYCQEISFELAHSDEAFWRDRSAPGTRYRRHRQSARSQSSNKAVVARSRAVFSFVGLARRSAILGAIVVAIRGL